jgi:hypothetical protein
MAGPFVSVEGGDSLWEAHTCVFQAPDNFTEKEARMAISATWDALPEGGQTEEALVEAMKQRGFELFKTGYMCLYQREDEE